MSIIKFADSQKHLTMKYYTLRIQTTIYYVLIDVREFPSVQSIHKCRSLVDISESAIRISSPISSYVTSWRSGHVVPL